MTAAVRVVIEGLRSSVEERAHHVLQLSCLHGDPSCHLSHDLHTSLLTKVQKCTTQKLRHRSHAKLSVAIGRRHDRRLQQKKIMGEPVVLTVGLENRRDGPLVRMKASPMKTHELMSVTMIKDICLSLLYIIYEISCRDNETMYKAQGGPK